MTFHDLLIFPKTHGVYRRTTTKLKAAQYADRLLTLFEMFSCGLHFFNKGTMKKRGHAQILEQIQQDGKLCKRACGV